MGKLGVSSFRKFLDATTLDTRNGVDLELSYHVPRVEQKLFNPLRNPFPSWVGRVNFLSRHTGEPKIWKCHSVIRR